MGGEPTLEEESEIHRLCYEAGDKAALLLLMRHCYLMHWDVPEWAQKAFLDVLDRVGRGDVRSWDDVFGEPLPKGKHMRTAQLEHRKYAIYIHVRAIVEKERVPIDGKLFERVGRETGLGGSTVIKGLYYRVERVLRRLPRVSARNENSGWGKWVVERNAALEAKRKKQEETSGK
jgi:hypothetical protein